MREWLAVDGSDLIFSCVDVIFLGPRRNYFSRLLLAALREKYLFESEPGVLYEYAATSGANWYVSKNGCSFSFDIDGGFST